MGISRCLDFLLFLIICAYSPLHHFVIHGLSEVHHNYIGHMRYRNELLFVITIVQNLIIMTHTHESPVPIENSAVGCYMSVYIINHSLFVYCVQLSELMF